ncbi:hypothetical protein BK009_01040 [Methanobacterium subterraneum]|uniref:Holliday junction resolvase n=1 Tax=Methanobacterium subterraneum TaxID=59277 RepID=A0A2H4VMS0_9EURY|nr:Holliday junction resolvase Hjc [Methanobacterium subterraneum]AUB59389.1 hypothetical protein BK009_01040 [Methanobacterium subterraneum]
MLQSVQKIKDKGIEHERNLVNSLKKRGYMAARLQSSGVSLPDVIAGDSETNFVFEVKSTRTNNIKIYKRQIHTLNNFAHNFNAKAFIAVFFVNRMIDFLFVKPSDFTEHEKMYTIDYNTACLEGKDLAEIISNELQKKLI